jgi:cell division protein FtsB
MAERRGARQRAWLKPVAAPLLALLGCAAILLLDLETGLLPLFRLADEVERTRGRVEQLERERARLRSRVQRLRGDPAALEAVAREQLGMVRPGELVVRWDD